MKHGMRLKINEIKDILSSLPDNACVNLTSPQVCAWLKDRSEDVMRARNWECPRGPLYM